MFAQINPLEWPNQNINPKVAAIIPCYRGSKVTFRLIESLISLVDEVYLVDDGCPNKTGILAIEKYANCCKLRVLINEINSGVGAATKIGIAKAIENDIIIKIDADGQMNPSDIPQLIEPIITGKAEAVKGNRFSSLDHILSMPKIRIIGNLALSFINKLSTGYWELFDPTNGFIAFKSSALKRVRIEKVDNRFFFESDLLFQCALAQITFTQFNMNSIYGQEISSLRPINEVTRFSGKHIINFFKRLIYQYFVLDFNAGSLELMGGFLGLLVTTIFTMRIFVLGMLYNKYATPGESSIFAVLAIFTIQMIIAFLYYDSTQQPLLRQLRK